MFSNLFNINTFRISFLLVPILILLSTTIAVSASVSLTWDPNDPTPEGYRVFARRSDQPYDYSHPNWEGGLTSCTIDSLDDQTDYYFVVRAYDGGVESEDSEEVYYVPAEAIDPFPVTDEDGDGMPDEWEALFGLNPTLNDADEDLDHDGISNRDEYRANLDPDFPGEGTAPRMPQVVFPASYAQVERNPELKLDSYSDAEGDAHIATQWQLYETSSDACLLDVVSDRRLDQLRIPIMLLNGNQTYHWRARFFDSGGQASQWSSVSYLITDESVGDFDGNGIPDAQEVGDVKADVARSLSSPATDCEPTNIMADYESTISEIEQVLLLDPAEFEIDETTPARLPSAMLAYKLVLQQPGQRALVTIHLSDAAPDGSTWLKYDAVNGWQDYSSHAVFSEDRRSVTVEIKDGGYGDADGVANGIILDPSGLSTAIASTPPTSTGTSAGGGGGGGGGGCFISFISKEMNEVAEGHGLWQWLKGNLNRFMSIFVN